MRIARALGEVIFRRQRRPTAVDCHAPAAVVLTAPPEKLRVTAPAGNRRWTPMRGGRPSCGCKRCKSLGPNGGRATAAGDGRLSCRLGGRGAAAARSDDCAFNCWRASGPNGPIRWPQANCASRENARRKKIPERRNTRDAMELTLPADSSSFPSSMVFFLAAVTGSSS